MTQELPLSGIRVIEMSHMIMGPSCGFFLGFLGAEVIKIEPPEGDKTRQLTGMGRGFFPTFNRGKKSIALDLKAADDRDILDRLLESADVFVENFRDVSLEKMGLAPQQLQARFPKLVIASCKGFLHGPYENRTAMDEVVQMMTGMAHMTGPSGRPLRIGSSANDIMGGLFGALGVVASLYRRQQGADGQRIRVGLFENCLLLVAQHMVQFDIEGSEAPPLPEREFSWPVYDIFMTADDKRLFVGAVTQSHWLSLCDLLGLDQLLADQSLQTKMDQINARDRIIPVVAEAIGGWHADDLSVALEARGIPFGPITRPVEMYDDPHVNRPGGLFVSRYDAEHDFRAPGLPLELNDEVLRPQNLDLPGVGEHREEILRELGLGIAKST